MTSNKNHLLFELTFNTSPIRSLYAMEPQKNFIQLIFRDATTRVMDTQNDLGRRVRKVEADMSKIMFNML